MEPVRSHARRKLFVYFALSIVFALATIPASKLRHFPPEIPPQHGLEWVYWLFVILTFVSLLPVLYALLELMYKRRWLPRFLSVLLSHQPRRETSPSHGAFARLQTSLGGRLTVASCLILAFVGFVSLLGIGGTKESSAEVYALTSSVSGIGRLGSVSNPYGGSTGESSPYVANLFFRTNDNNKDEYFKNCVAIVDRLKRAGAKAVLVKALNSYPEGNPTRYLREIDSSGIAVFALPQNSVYYLTTLSSMKFWANTVLTLPSNESGTVRRLYKVKPMPGEAHGYFVPPYSKNTEIGARDIPIEDVSLRLAGKYLGYSNDITPRREEDVVTYGDLRMPITSNGWLYAYMTRPADSWFSMYVQRPGNSDSLSYTVLDPVNRRERPMTEDDLEAAYRGKIVLVDWYNDGDRYSRDYSMVVYGSVLDQMLKRTMLRVLEWGPFWFTLILAVLCSLVAYYTRGLLSVLLMVLIGVIAVVVGTILAGHFLFVDIVYPITTVILAMFILPSVTMVAEADGST